MITFGSWWHQYALTLWSEISRENQFGRKKKRQFNLGGKWPLCYSSKRVKGRIYLLSFWKVYNILKPVILVEMLLKISIASECKQTTTLLTSSTLRFGIWKNDRSNFNLTCVWSSIKHSRMFLRTSTFNWEHIEPSDHVSDEVPSLLWSHKAMSPSLAAAITILPGDAPSQNQFRKPIIRNGHVK